MDPWNDAPEPDDKEGVAPSKSDRDRVTVTLKGGPGFEQPWIVIHAASVDEANELLDDMDTVGLRAKVIQSSASFREFSGSTSPQRAANGPAAPSWSPNTPAPANGPSCVHGARVYRSGNKAGKNWSAYFCPNKVCDAEWVK